MYCCRIKRRSAPWDVFFFWVEKYERGDVVSVYQTLYPLDLFVSVWSRMTGCIGAAAVLVGLLESLPLLRVTNNTELQLWRPIKENYMLRSETTFSLTSDQSGQIISLCRNNGVVLDPRLCSREVKCGANILVSSPYLPTFLSLKWRGRNVWQHKVMVSWQQYPSVTGAVLHCTAEMPENVTS